MTEKSVDQWVSEIESEVAREQAQWVQEVEQPQRGFMEEVIDDRALFGRLFEYATVDAVKHQWQKQPGEVNTQQQVNWAEIEQKQRALTNPTKGLDLERE